MLSLGLKWLLGLGARSPEAKRGLLRGSLWIAVLSLSLSLAALGLTRSLVSGFEATLARALGNTQGEVLHHFGRWVTEAEEIQILESLEPGPNFSEFFWTTQGLIVGKTVGRGVLIEGRHSRNSEGKIISSHLFKNEPSPEGSTPRAILGKALADVLGVKPGDEVRILLPGILKSSIPFRVFETHQPGLYELESRFVVLDNPSLMDWLKQKSPESLNELIGDSHGFRLFFDESFKGLEGEEKLDAWAEGWKFKVANADSALPADLSTRIQTWRDMKSTLFKGIGYNKIELSLVLGFLSLVAALNIAATLIVLFLERDREIALLHAIGFGPRALWAWVLLLGSLLGAVSTVFGILLTPILGFLLSRLPFLKIPQEIYNIDHLPIRLNLPDFIFLSAWGLGVSILVAATLGYKLSRMSFSTVIGNRRA